MGGAFRKIGEAFVAHDHVSPGGAPLARKAEQSEQPGEVSLWSGTGRPLVEPDSFHGRFAELRPVLLRDEDFAHWYAAGRGRPSVPPSLVAGAFLLALREGWSDREAEQRMRFDLRWKWALGLGWAITAATTPPSACSAVACWRTRKRGGCSRRS